MYHILIDFNNFASRARAKDDGLYNRVGNGTGIVFYMLRMTKALAELMNPCSITFVEDGGINSERKKFYPDYKAKRIEKRDNSTDEEELEYKEFLRQRLRFKEYMQVANVKHIRCKGEEADDVIAYMCHLAEGIKPFSLKGHLKHKLLIVSTDTDFVHLVSDTVHVWSPIKEKLYTLENTDPNMELIKKSILGDKTDQIYGIPGVGDTTVEQALKDYYSSGFGMEKFIEACSASTNSRVKKISKESDIVRRNRKIISLQYDSGFVKNLLPENKEEIRRVLTEFKETIDYTKLMNLAYEDEFKSIYVNIKNNFFWASKLNF